MKGFIILICYIGIIFAAPQYNYNPPIQGTGIGPGISAGPLDNGGKLGGGLLDVRLLGPASASASSSSFIGNTGAHHQLQHGSSSVHSHHAGSFSGGQTFGGSGSGGFVPSTGGFSNGISNTIGLNNGQFGSSFSSGFGASGSGIISPGDSGGDHHAIVTKQFFIHSAPEEQDEFGGDKVINLGPGRKHYRVVFIKAPHQSIQGGRVRFVAPANEEKTVIYVLSKKSNLADIAADVQQAHSEPTKPDVFFIKYKTPEEAAHAQKQIQAQYDQLGGTSQISDEGYAPISSVIGALGHGAAGGAGYSTSHQSSFTSSGSTNFGGSIASTGAGVSNIISGGTDSGFIGSGGGAAASYLPPNH